MILFTEHQSHTIEKKQAVDNMDEEIPPYVQILQGRDGRDGRDGMQGPRGPPGRDCCNGLGVNGSAGEPGMDGMPGEQGPQSMKGDPGPAGADGKDGAVGAKGDPGILGLDGSDGERGDPGHDGDKGEQGDAGPAGQDGVPGEQGDTGAPGVDGSNGTKGEKGDTGPQGLPGDTGLPGPPGLDGNGIGGGVTYVRWGRTICPNTTGTELVYAGRVGGSRYSHSGGGGNYQCVTEEPENFDFVAGTQLGSYMYGAEYETSGHGTSSTANVHNMDVPCAVCYVATKAALLMIPGKYHCPENWRREYYGYLMAERYTHYRSTFECVDANPEGATGGDEDHDGILFYHVEPQCGSLPCLPYEEEKEMTCAVCSR